jgi:signal transduction histidine kinase
VDKAALDALASLALGLVGGTVIGLLVARRRRGRAPATPPPQAPAAPPPPGPDPEREAFFLRALEELRIPLGLLATSLELALRRRPEVPELSAALRDAQREAERIARVAERLTALHAAERQARRDPVDLAVVARGAVQAALRPAEAKQLSVNLDVPKELPLAGDRALLEQALAELLENAIRVTRFGGAVVLRAEASGGQVRVSVRDEGPGVPAARRASLFEPLHRGGEQRASGPTGLALVRAIARGHGGRVFIEEAPGQGALVGFEIPARA